MDALWKVIQEGEALSVSKNKGRRPVKQEQRSSQLQESVEELTEVTGEEMRRVKKRYRRLNKESWRPEVGRDSRRRFTEVVGQRG